MAPRLSLCTVQMVGLISLRRRACNGPAPPCRFASTTALAQLAGALESAADLFEKYVKYLYLQCAFEAGQGPKPDEAACQGLATRVTKPLGEHQKFLLTCTHEARIPSSHVSQRQVEAAPHMLTIGSAGQH